jgi:hypothetical protein
MVTVRYWSSGKNDHKCALALKRIGHLQYVQNDDNVTLVEEILKKKMNMEKNKYKKLQTQPPH